MYVMNKNRLQNIKENWHILKCCVESILLCGHQCIALRGDVEKLEKSVNPGNFLVILRLLSNHDPVLKAHLENPRLKIATYVTGYGKTDHFAHYFKIKLLVFKGSVDLKQ